MYFVEDDGIYRVDKRGSRKKINIYLDYPLLENRAFWLFKITHVSSLILGEMKSEQVLNLEQISEQETTLESERIKQQCLWTVQRIRLSPQEKHLAATVKSNHNEEPRWKIDHSQTHKQSFIYSLFLRNTCSSQMWAILRIVFLRQVCCCKAQKDKSSSSGTSTHNIYPGKSPQLWYVNNPNEYFYNIK